MWEFCVCLCIVMHYAVFILILQSSWRGKESWLLCYYCLTDVLILLIFRGSSSWCRGLVCSMWLWYCLIILTYFLVRWNAAYGDISSELTRFAETKTIFRVRNTNLFGNCNLWRLDIYNESSQDYCIRPEGKRPLVHKGLLT